MYSKQEPGCKVTIYKINVNQYQLILASAEPNFRTMGVKNTLSDQPYKIFILHMKV